jgi:RHS repeat-associated protein
LGDSYEGALKNNYLYNDKELFEDADLNWYDYGFRNYDPQIGRFTQLDPLTDSYPFLTPYQYASCDPIKNIDIDGLEGETALTAATAKTLGVVVVKSTIKWKTLEPVVVTATKTATKVKQVVTATSVAVSIAQNSVRVITTTHSNCHKPADQSPNGDFNFSFDLSWLRGNGGGIRFTSKNGGNEETRSGENADPESEDISSLIDLFYRQKNISTDLFKTSFPNKKIQSDITKLILDIKKYMKTAQGLEERGALPLLSDINQPNYKKPEPVTLQQTRPNFSYKDTDAVYFFDETLNGDKYFFIKYSNNPQTPDTNLIITVPDTTKKTPPPSKPVKKRKQ